MLKAIITQRESMNQYGGLTDSLEKEYVDYLSSLGIELYPISCFTECVERVVKAVEWNLLILSGGGCLLSEAYGHDVANGFQQVHRDRVENQLVEAATKNNIPILGICRGMQKLNAFYGGKTKEFDGLKTLRRVRENHNVRVLETGETFEVNHYHGDGVFPKFLGKELLPVAIDDESGTIEAFIHKNNRVLAVQWHPERKDISLEADRWFRQSLSKLTSR